LQQFLRVFKNFPEFVALRAEHFRSQLSRNFYSSDGSIFRHEPDFVDANAWISGHRGF
jgi:hypothetical protein